jgi:hypothetical protein
VQLGELEVALEIAKASEGTEAKWKQLGELAMSSGRLDVRPLTFPSNYGCHAVLTTLSSGLKREHVSHGQSLRRVYGML